MTRRRPAVRRALFAAAALALLRPATAENWRDWRPLPDQRISAAFEPFVDMRDGKLDKSDVSGYANLARKTPFPGEIVFSGDFSGDGGGLPDGGLEIVVDAVSVDEAHSGKPSIGKNDHYAGNPFLPYAMPVGPCDEPAATTRSFVPRDGTGKEIRVPVVTSSGDLWTRGDAACRIRWRILSAANGREIARGVLPEAFTNTTRSRDGKTPDAVYAMAGPGNRAKTRPGRATENTWRAWPALVESFASVVFDDAGFGEAFAGADPSAVSNFFARARLANLVISKKGAKSGENAWPAAWQAAGRRQIVVPKRWNVNLYDGDSAYFSQSPVAVRLRSPGKDAKNGKRAPGGAEEADGRFDAIRIPGATLRRPAAPFVVATAAFLVAFASGSVALLVFFFAFRKGEKRLAVWHALPAWCVLCSLFGWLALPLALDRRPYSDVTEWRYSIDGLDESFCIATGRAQTFESKPTSWSVPGGAWFGMPYNWRDRYQKGRVFGFNANADGDATLTLPPRNAGSEDRATAFRFAPRKPAVALSPDPAFSFDGFLREASRAPSAQEDGGMRPVFSKFLSEWSGSGFRKPGASGDDPLPQRSVTAHRALDGVFVYSRGSWYALGPMAAGETRALDPSMKVVSGIDTSDTPDDNLFKDAPFAVVEKDVESFASAWLAREKGGRRGGDADGGKSGKGGKRPSLDSYGPEEIEDIVGRLGSAFAVSIFKQDEEDAPFLSPAFPGSAKDVQSTGRIATVEVFQ